jgi:hypothetical protein
VKLAVEQITGVYEDDDEFQSKDMRRGVEHEPAAIRAYDSLRGEMAHRTGFFALNDCMAGCSLDFGIDRLIGFAEIKYPKARIHLEYISKNRVPAGLRKTDSP